MYGITQVVLTKLVLMMHTYHNLICRTCTCIYAYMYVYMYEPQYNECTEVQTLGTVLYDAQK